jgi:hypothetical protein
MALLPKDYTNEMILIQLPMHEGEAGSAFWPVNSQSCAGKRDLVR